MQRVAINKIRNIGTVFVLFVISLGLLSAVQRSNAALTSELDGWAWSDNIGWISFRGANHGVDVDMTTGNLSGYAWSDNIGWISFDKTSGCPEGGCVTQPRVDLTTGEVSGWARACSGMIETGKLPTDTNNSCAGSSRTDGWDGWIKLGSNWGNALKFVVDGLGGRATGYAWGANVVGWIVWSGVTSNEQIPPPPPMPDLKSQGLTVPAGPYAVGQTVTLRAEVTNIGNLDAGAFTDNFTYYRGTSVDASTVWKEFSNNTVDHLSGLSAGATAFDGTVANPIRFVIPEAGTYYFQHCVDAVPPEGAVDEGPANEGNNCTNLTDADSSVVDDDDIDNGDDSIEAVKVGGEINADTPVPYNTKSVVTWNTWDSTGICTPKVNGPGGPWSGVNGTEATPSLTTDTVYALWCDDPDSGDDDIPLDSVTIKVTINPTLSAEPRIVNQGGSTYISYDTNGQTCTLDGGSFDNLSVTGVATNIEEIISAFTTYTLDCPVGEPTVDVEIVPKGFET